MAHEPNELDDTWADLVPEQPESKDRLPLYLAIGAGVLVVICILAVGGFLLAQVFFPRPDEPTIQAPPTQAVLSASLESEAPDQEGVTVEPAMTPTGSPPTTDSGVPTPEIVQSPAPTAEATSPPAPTVTLSTLAPGEVAAVRLPSPPVLDGLLAEWVEVPPVESAYQVYQAPGWDGSADLTAFWRLAWDATNLYIAVEVTDNIHVQNQTGNQIYRGDSVDMQFDTDRLGDLADGLSPDDFQITLSPGDFVGLPPSVARFQGTPSGQILDAPGGNQVLLVAQRTPAGYILEAAIPWSDLNLGPVEGLVIGLALNANDNDTPGTAVQEVMKSHVASRTLTDPRGWGTLILR